MTVAEMTHYEPGVLGSHLAAGCHCFIASDLLGVAAQVKVLNEDPLIEINLIYWMISHFLLQQVQMVTCNKPTCELLINISSCGATVYIVKGMQCIEWGFMPPLYTYWLNWSRITS